MARASSSEPTTAEQYAAAQAAEWTTYVATTAIDFYGVRAYNAGDPVPVSAVDGDSGWVPEKAVRKITDDQPAFAESATVVEPTAPTINPSSMPAPAAATPTQSKEG